MTAKKRASSAKKCNFAGGLSESETSRRELILTIQAMRKNGNSISEITRITKKDWKTVKKYMEGDPDILCRSIKRSPLDEHTGFIINSIKEGLTAASIAKRLKSLGCSCTISNSRQFITKVAYEHGLEIAKYCSRSSKYNQEGSLLSQKDYITRKGIFNHLWMKIELAPAHREYLWEHYDSLPLLDKCIREFREIFARKSIPRLHLFIERYRQCSLKEIASFANGLKKDMDAVENAVASPLSNAFVEGNNSKVKTIKKSMYGRCGKLLLEAKLMYDTRT